MYYTSEKSPIRNLADTGTLEIRYRKNGRPYVAISTREAKALSGISNVWKFQKDVIDRTIYITPVTKQSIDVPRTKAKPRTKITTIRVDTEEWDEYVKLCKAVGTSTCRELRLFIHLKLEEARYPATTRRFPGVG